MDIGECAWGTWGWGVPWSTVEAVSHCPTHQPLVVAHACVWSACVGTSLGLRMPSAQRSGRGGRHKSGTGAHGTLRRHDFSASHKARAATRSVGPRHTVLLRAAQTIRIAAQPSGGHALQHNICHTLRQQRLRHWSPYEDVPEPIVHTPEAGELSIAGGDVR